MFHIVRFLTERFEVDLVAPREAGAEAAAARLGASGARLDLVAPAPSSAARRWLRLGPYEVDPALARAIRGRLKAPEVGVVHVEKPAMLPYLPRGLRVPIVLDTFAFGLDGARRALRHERGLVRRARNLVRLARFAAFDALAWPRLHCVLVVSEDDRRRCLAARPGERVLLVPNGVDCAAVRPAAQPAAGPPVLLLTGDMGFDQNVEAASALATRVFPVVRARHPDAVLRLVGRNPGPRVRALAGAGVVVTGEVPDMTPHLHAATVFVAPIALGAGTRTKVLEAMAAGLPVVTTSTGIEGIDAVAGEHAVVEDDPEAFARAVLELLGRPEARHRLGATARRLVEARYDWGRCLAPLEDLYAPLVPARARQ
jgi:glycosyltransferase involved in cell wall biosynthesis